MLNLADLRVRCVHSYAGFPRKPILLMIIQFCIYGFLKVVWISTVHIGDFRGDMYDTMRNHIWKEYRKRNQTDAG